jgi:uncharacterized protein
MPSSDVRPIAAITGASSGIGAEFARRLAPTHDLILVARRKDRMEQLARELAPCAVEVIEADLANEAATEAVALRLAAECRIELLVNNAGFGSKGLFWKATLESQEAMHRVHVWATMRLTHAVLGPMVERQRGAVINVASIASFVRSPGNTSYGATKAWMAVFSEALALELQVQGSPVTVQALCPGYTYSEFHDVLGVDRTKMGPQSVWMTAEFVVRESLAALPGRKLFVVPGWKYKLVAALLPKLPVGLRLAIERKSTRSRYRQLTGETR